jgi:hypothetical protein
MQQRHRMAPSLLIFITLLGLPFLFYLLAREAQPARAQAPQPAIGVGLTPANFPRHSPDDVARMYDIARQLGTHAMINVQWREKDIVTVAMQMLQLARRQQLTSIIQLNILEGSALGLPAGISGSSMVAPAVKQAYLATVKELAALHPDYLSLAADINMLLARGIEPYVEFAQVYKQAYQVAKAESPKTKVFLTFSWDIFKTASEEQSRPLAQVRTLVDLFRPNLDVVAFSTFPMARFKSPGDLPVDYYDGIKQFVDAKDELIFQVAWPSAGAGGEATQRAFVDRLPSWTARVKPNILLWPILHDLNIGGSSPVTSLGLYSSAGTAKSAAAPFGRIGGAPRPPIAALAGPRATTATPVSEAPRQNASDKFAIYLSTLSGAPQTLFMSDPKREINHARVSPDRTRVAFTRYNIFNGDGEALETNGYDETEAIICRIDGAKCEIVLPSRKGIMSANAYWTPDGQNLLFVSSDTPNNVPAIKMLNVATHRITPIYAPDDLVVVDPHQIDATLVMPGRVRNNLHMSELYIFDTKTKVRRQLTAPKFKNFKRMDPPLGDHDPKLSPDGKTVAVMRHMAQDEWHIVLVDVATGAEKDISKPDAVDAVPEWSSDGKLLIFWSVDRTNLKQSGLYTMRPDGTARKRVPLPGGNFYTMPAFLPGEGADPDSRIIYSRKIEPKM